MKILIYWELVTEFRENSTIVDEGLIITYPLLDKLCKISISISKLFENKINVVLVVNYTLRYCVNKRITVKCEDGSSLQNSARGQINSLYVCLAVRHCPVETAIKTKGVLTLPFVPL